MSEGERSGHALEPTMLFDQGTRSGGVTIDVDPLVGSKLRHFDIEKLLGRGGMGSVYLARDTSLDRPVAIKVLSPEISHHTEVVARFEREARAQARLVHPNVTQIHFIGEERGTHFFAMEYVPGPALNALLERGRVAWTDALEYAVAAARGLRAALAQGFIHRDVKPSNLMLDPDSRVKILDFGLVKSTRGDVELTRDGAIVGSPLYMAPEQGRAEDVDHRADIYSLGCALYHMLTGRPPFTAASDVGVISMHVTDRATAVRVHSPEVPEALERIVERMMAKRPADRFATYDEVLAALESARPGRSEHTGFPMRAVALAIDVAPLLAAAAFVGVWAAALAAVYFVLCHRLGGRTLGKWLLDLKVNAADGEPLSWWTAVARFAAFSWGGLAWSALGAVVYFVHRHDRVAFELSRLSWQQSLLPVIYASLAGTIFVGWLGGFLLAVFHPGKRALHDLLARTLVIHVPAPPGSRRARVRRFLATRLTRPAGP